MKEPSGMQEEQVMLVDKIRAKERGVTKTPWLRSAHSFSFGKYHNLRRINFGTLRVLNEDTVQPGRGFPPHGHDNMEIVTIVLDGELEHKDSQGHEGVLTPFQVQRMTAGTGIEHSEYNHSKEKPVHFLQIWIYPKERDLLPSYESNTFDLAEPGSSLEMIVGEVPHGKALRIHQDARLYLGHFKKQITYTHELVSPKHGVYCFVIEGRIVIEKEEFGPGDAVGITKAESFSFHTKEPAKVLLIEVNVNTL